MGGCLLSVRDVKKDLPGSRKENMMSKAHNLPITQEFLNFRANRAKNFGYGKAAWIKFCEELLEQGYDLSLREALETYSKYIKVTKKDAETGSSFLVRFSNHKPNKDRELRGDCDFFVGITNLSVSTWRDAITAVQKFYGESDDEYGEEDYPDLSLSKGWQGGSVSYDKSPEDNHADEWHPGHPSNYGDN